MSGILGMNDWEKSEELRAGRDHIDEQLLKNESQAGTWYHGVFQEAEDNHNRIAELLNNSQ